MKILAVCLGRPEVLAGKKYKTGINKLAIQGAIMVDAEGLVGDAILNRKHHGGVDQAVYIEGSIDLDWWQAELGRDLRTGQRRVLDHVERIGPHVDRRQKNERLERRTRLTLRLTLQNVERFGIVDYQPPPEDNGTEWLDELAKLILGQPSRFAALARLIVPTPQ